MYAIDANEAKYQFLINKPEDIGTKHFNDTAKNTVISPDSLVWKFCGKKLRYFSQCNSKAFIEYSSDMYDIHKNIEEYNLNKKWKILTVFDDMIADMLNNKKLNPIVTELFIRGRKLNISFAFITQSYIVVPKNTTLNSTHYFVMKIPNKRELQKIAFNIPSDIDFQDLINLYRKCAANLYSF